MIFPRITSLRQGSGWQARISADKPILLGSVSSTISEIRGEFRTQTRAQVLIYHRWTQINRASIVCELL